MQAPILILALTLISGGRTRPMDGLSAVVLVAMCLARQLTPLTMRHIQCNAILVLKDNDGCGLAHSSGSVLDLQVEQAYLETYLLRPFDSLYANPMFSR